MSLETLLMYANIIIWSPGGGVSLLGVVLIVVVSLLIALGGNFLFRRLGRLDRPGADVPIRKPVPCYQGVFVLIALLICSVFVPHVWTNTVGQSLMIGTVLLGVFALINDIVDRYTDMRGLSPLIRLAIQVLIIIGIVLYSGVGAGLTIAYIELPQWLGVMFAVIWILGFTNAMNWFDGIYGFAGGNAAIGYLTTILLIQYIVLPNYTLVSSETLGLLQMVSQVSIVMLIISIIFTAMEYKPLGLIRDIGVIIYGFSLGYMALVGGAKIGMVLAVLFPMILDSIWVVVHRVVWMRKSPFHGDYTHLHHRLLVLGWSRSEIRVVVRSFSSIMMVLMLLQGTDSGNKIIIFGLFAVGFFAIHVYLYWIKKIPYEYRKEKKPMDLVLQE